MLGFGAKQTNNPGQGSIYVQLDKGSYTTGQQVNGTVMLFAESDLQNAQSVWITLRGEEASFLVERKSKTTSTGSGKNRRTKTTYYNVYHRDKRVTFNQSFKIYDFPSNVIPRGQYQFPVSFPLKKELPSSFRYEFLHHGTNFCQNSYTLEAETRASSGQQVHPMEALVPIIVNQDLSVHPMNTRQSIEKEVVTWCCCNQGKSNIITHFEKASYTVGEKAQLFVELDNKDCKARVESVKTELLQTLIIKAMNYTRLLNFTHDSHSVAGIGANEQRIGVDCSKHDLNVRPYEPGDPSKLMPTCQSHLIMNQYELVATAVIDGCTCCDGQPQCRLAVNVGNFQLPIPTWNAMPQNWQPQMMGQYNAQVSYNMNPQAQDFQLDPSYEPKPDIDDDDAYPQPGGMPPGYGNQSQMMSGGQSMHLPMNGYPQPQQPMNGYPQLQQPMMQAKMQNPGQVYPR